MLKFSIFSAGIKYWWTVTNVIDLLGKVLNQGERPIARDHRREQKRRQLRWRSDPLRNAGRHFRNGRMYFNVTRPPHCLLLDHEYLPMDRLTLANVSLCQLLWCCTDPVLFFPPFFFLLSFRVQPLKSPLYHPLSFPANQATLSLSLSLLYTPYEILPDGCSIFLRVSWQLLVLFAISSGWEGGCVQHKGFFGIIWCPLALSRDSLRFIYTVRDSCEKWGQLKKPWFQSEQTTI